MEHFNDFLNKFNSSSELRDTAIQLNINNLPAVKNKIHELTLQEAIGQPLDNEIIQVLNDPQATQQVVKQLESMLATPGNTVDSTTPDASESEPGTSTQNTSVGRPLKRQRKNETAPSTQNASADSVWISPSDAHYWFGHCCSRIDICRKCYLDHNKVGCCCSYLPKVPRHPDYIKAIRHPHLCPASKLRGDVENAYCACRCNFCEN